ncbi:MAG: DUF1153 domain-containing protein [Gammaproteobacteria bacterium]|nr:DUF1153 domain-containing protein [Gammaproteobacteria bacterium]
MSDVMEEEIKRWTARRKSALVLDILQGRTTVSESARQFDLTPAEVEGWVEDGKRGMENALRAKPEDVREQYERQLKELQEAYGEAMLLAEHLRQRALHRRAYSFFAMTSFNAVTSSARSAYIRLSLAFSSSSSRNRRTSDTSIPPYFDFQT